MRFYILICVLFYNVVGASEQTQKLNSQIQYEEKSGDPLNKTSSGESSRKEKEWQITLGSALSQFSETTGVFSFGYFYEDYLISLSLYGMDDLDSNNGDLKTKDGKTFLDTDTKESLNAFSFSVRKYLGNSFYISPDIYFRDYARYPDHSSLRSYTLKDIGAGLSIGNQWYWKYLTFGIEWLGVRHSVYLLDQWGEEPSGISGRKFSFTLLGLSLGASF